MSRLYSHAAPYSMAANQLIRTIEKPHKMPPILASA
jgi:hypothetical protein